MSAPLQSEITASGRPYADAVGNYQLYEVQFFVWKSASVWMPDGPEWPPQSGQAYDGWDFAEDQVTGVEMIVFAPESAGPDRTLPPTIPLTAMVGVDFSVNPEEPHPYSWRYQHKERNPSRFALPGQRYAGILRVTMADGSRWCEVFTIQP